MSKSRFNTFFNQWPALTVLFAGLILMVILLFPYPPLPEDYQEIGLINSTGLLNYTFSHPSNLSTYRPVAQIITWILCRACGGCNWLAQLFNILIISLALIVLSKNNKNPSYFNMFTLLLFFCCPLAFFYLFQFSALNYTLASVYCLASLILLHFQPNNSVLRKWVLILLPFSFLSHLIPTIPVLLVLVIELFAKPKIYKAPIFKYLGIITACSLILVITTAHPIQFSQLNDLFLYARRTSPYPWIGYIALALQVIAAFIGWHKGYWRLSLSIPFFMLMILLHPNNPPVAYACVPLLFSVFIFAALFKKDCSKWLNTTIATISITIILLFGLSRLGLEIPLISPIEKKVLSGKHIIEATSQQLEKMVVWVLTSENQKYEFFVHHGPVERPYSNAEEKISTCRAPTRQEYLPAYITGLRCRLKIKSLPPDQSFILIACFRGNTLPGRKPIFETINPQCGKASIYLVPRNQISNYISTSNI